MAGPNQITSAERNERELNADINAAIAGTEQEIFDEAMGDESLELDGDTSLEEMGDGLEGEHVDPDEGDEEAEEEVDAELEAGDQRQQARQPQAEEEEPEAGEQQIEQQQEPDLGRGRVPSQALREERQRRQAAEADRNAALERIRALEQRFDQTLTQIATQRQPPAEKKPEEKPPKPDPFADPEGHDQWILAEQRRAVEEALKADREERQRERQAEQEQRVNINMARMRRSERGDEFQAGYDLLTQTLQRLGPNDPQGRAFVANLMSSPDPAAEVLDWFEQNGAAEWREQYQQQRQEAFLRQAEELGFQVQMQPQRGQRGRQEQPRHEVRLPSSLQRQPPSLNSAAGGGRQQIQDPEMLDDSEESVFRFATNRG